MTLYTQQPDGTYVVASQEEIAAAVAAPDPTGTNPSETQLSPAETPSEESETPSGESGAETTPEQDTAPDGTNYGTGQIDAQPENAPVVPPPAQDAPAQYQEGKIDDPNDVPAQTQEQAETQYQQPAAAPDTEGL